MNPTCNDMGMSHKAEEGGTVCLTCGADLGQPRFTVEVFDRSDDGPEYMPHVYVYDDDFGYDTVIQFSGDFATVEQKREYAEAVAAALNAATIPTSKTTKFPYVS